jgi:hypothetical protein
VKSGWLGVFIGRAKRMHRRLFTCRSSRGSSKRRAQHIVACGSKERPDCQSQATEANCCERAAKFWK